MAFLNMKTVLTAAVLTVGLVLPAAAQIKVGVVNLQKALESTAEIKRAEAELKAKFAPRQEDLNKMQLEIQKLQQDMEANQGKYNDAAMAEINQRAQRRQVQVQRATQSLQDDVNRDRQDVLGRVGKNLQEIVKKVADEKGLDLVVDSGSTLFAKPAMDISADVTAAYDKAFPVKK